MFACIEGIDASGKATQSKLLAEQLNAKLYSFPDYETPMGRLIKAHLLKQWHAQLDGVREAEWPATLDATVFQAVQLANRMEHAVEIANMLRAGRNVVADRYWPAGVVYGGADGLEPETMIDLHAYLPQPDLFMLMDMPPELSVKRRPDRRDRYETQVGLMEEVARRYKALWREMQEREGRLRWVVIDASQDIEGVAEQVRKAVAGALR